MITIYIICQPSDSFEITEVINFTILKINWFSDQLIGLQKKFTQGLQIE